MRPNCRLDIIEATEGLVHELHNVAHVGKAFKDHQHIFDWPPKIRPAWYIRQVLLP